MKAPYRSCSIALAIGLLGVQLGAGHEYREASLDQATIEIIGSLKIERYAGFDEEGMQAEYQWALDMAELCLERPKLMLSRGIPFASTEFQRHSARTSRHRGFLEQALRDYETAIDYAEENSASFEEPRSRLEALVWRRTILDDIADTYFIMGAYGQAADLSYMTLNIVKEVHRTLGKRPLDSAVSLDRLARIAQRQSRFADSATLQERSVRSVEQFAIPAYFGPYLESGEMSLDRPWSETVRQADVRAVLDETKPALNDLREAYYRLARALRLNGQLDEAAYALETAELTPWQTVDLYRQNLDFYVDREQAFLALDRGDAAEAVRRGNDCLSKYVASIDPWESIELLDLVSRALEQQGNLQAAMDKLDTAIGIVESNRANLTEDQHKRLFVAQYADLYRRMCALTIQIGAEQTRSGAKRGADAGPFDRPTIEQSFKWSERAKARAMLDTLRRLDRRMAVAIDRGDPDAIRRTRDLAGAVLTVAKLQDAKWWHHGTALLEYMVTPRGVWLWVVTKSEARLHRIDAAPDEIDRHARALAKALQPSSPADQTWIEPAAWLCEKIVHPADAQLAGVTHLLIVGDGVLREIPFEVLLDYPQGRDQPERLLIERFTISYAPSATIAAMVAERKDRPSYDFDFWGFASTRFRSAVPPPLDKGGLGGVQSLRSILRSATRLDLPPLPYASKEVTRIADHFPAHRRRVYLDHHDANRTAKQILISAAASGELASVRFLHFATHAILDADRPTRSGLVLCPPYLDAKTDSPAAPAAAPTREATQSDSARVTHRPALPKRRPTRTAHPAIMSLPEIASLDLDSEVVVLSACHTLGGDAIDGDWLNGLTRSVLVGGGRSVVCTLWQVSDSTALMLMPAFYHALLQDPSTERGPAAALRQAKLPLLQSPMYRHPSNWAAFVCYGGITHPD